MTSLLPHLPKAILEPPFETLEEQAKAAEAWETAPWAAAAILEVEILTQEVVDPCCGTGILSDALCAAGYTPWPQDLYYWGYPPQHSAGDDWLKNRTRLDGASVFMNPPFSLACQFVDKAFELGARKVVCFQRLAWRESQDRRQWWDNRPPARIWLCGDRAHTWLFTVPPEERKNPRFMPCAWYVWEQGHRGIEATNTIWKSSSYP